MRDALPFALLVCACGASLRGRPAEGTLADPVASASAPVAPAAASLRADSRFDAIRSRGAAVAPGMRPMAERETAGEAVELVRAESQDECVRVAFEATSPVVARLMDAKGGSLASNALPASTGTLGEGGPVCIRKGDAVIARVEAAADTADAAIHPAPHVLWVAWAAP